MSLGTWFDGAARGALVLAAGLALALPAAAFRGPELSPEQERELRQNFSLSVSKLKGPYTENMCVCPNGTKRPIRSASGSLGAACENPIFCAAYRAPWGEALAKQRLYIGNIFSRDVYEWDGYADHNDVVRGYILEKYFTETNPGHKLAQLRAFRGLASSEEEAPAAKKFFERYLSAPEFDASRHFLLAYELQKRFFVRSDIGQIQEIRAMATRIESMDSRFKPLKDAVHNQLSAGLVPKLEAYQGRLPQGAERTEIGRLVAEITKLTSIDEKALEPQIAEIQDEALRGQVRALVPGPNTDPTEGISELAQLMLTARQAVAAKNVSPGDARRLIDLDITAGAVLSRRGTALVESNARLTARQNLQLLAALTNATYATGLLNDRERDAALGSLQELAGQVGAGPRRVPARPHPGRASGRVGAGQRHPPLRRGLGPVDPPHAPRRRDRRRHPARLATAALRPGGAAPRRLRRRRRTPEARLLRPGRRRGRSRAQPRPRARKAARRPEGRGLRARRDRRAPRDPRRPRARGGDPHPRRGQRPLPRPASRTSPRHPERRPRVRRLRPPGAP